MACVCRDVFGHYPGNRSYNSTSVDVVFAHCRRPLRLWRLKSLLYPVRLGKVYVYSKCGSKIWETAQHNITVIRIPNVGRVDHSYAYHIGQYYDSIGPQTLFLKDSWHREPSEVLLRLPRQNFRDMMGYPFACLHQYNIWHAYDDMVRFHLPQYVKSHDQNPYEATRFQSPHGIMERWVNTTIPHISDSYKGLSCPVCYGGMFLASAERIHQVPRRVWWRIVSSLSRGDNIEESHFLERSWAMLLGEQLSANTQVSLNKAVSASPSHFDWDSFRGVQRDCRDTCVSSEKLVAFVAIGQKRHFVQDSLRYFDRWDCIVFVHSQRRISSRCATVKRKWSWISFLRYMTPVRVAKYDSVTIVLDDVTLLNYNPMMSIEGLKKYGANIITPRVDGAHFRGMTDPGTRVTFLNFTEIFMTTFDRNAWSCFWSMIDRIVPAFPESVGWGYDVCLPAFCPDLRHVSIPSRVRHAHAHTANEYPQHARGEREVAVLRDMASKLVHKPCLDASQAV
jgi:hypothetical protein